MSDSVKKIKLSTYDDLFTPDSKDNLTDGTPAQITLSKLIPFPHHPFKLYKDEQMQEMVNSVQHNGVLTPIIVRPGTEDGQFEIISGHNRVEAARLAGLTEIPAIIREMDNETAIVAMVDSNLRQRDKLLPSEKAFAYKMKLEAINRQGKRSDLTSGQVDPKLSSGRARDLIAEEAGESSKQIHRFIRLTELIPPLLELTDEAKMALNPAVALSYLTPSEQEDVLDIMTMHDCSPSLSQAEHLKKLSQEGSLDRSAINAILSEPKPQQKQIVFKGDQVEKYFPKDTSPEQIQETIIRLLEVWYQRRNQERGR
jgi:ParB family chromosome partitioning protein